MGLFLHWYMGQSSYLTSNLLFQGFRPYFLSYKVVYFWYSLGTKKPWRLLCLFWNLLYVGDTYCTTAYSPILLTWGGGEGEIYPSLISWIKLSCSSLWLFCPVADFLFLANQGNNAVGRELLSWYCLYTHNVSVEWLSFSYPSLKVVQLSHLAFTNSFWGQVLNGYSATSVHIRIF